MIKMYGHGGSGNHGCEAIVRTTIKLLQSQCVLYTEDQEQDLQYKIDEICEVIQNTACPIPKVSIKWWLARLQEKFLHRIDLTIKYKYLDFFRTLVVGDICLSIGGDTYCYAGTEKLAAFDFNIKKQKAKTVLWGCSVEPELLKNPEIARDLSSFDLITARESISYKALKKVNSNTILVPDTAFSLSRIDLPLPDGWVEGKMIGINASPLILSSSQKPEIALDAYRELINYILSKTEYGIALIPHVVWDTNDDREVLIRLYNEYAVSRRIVMIKDCNCMELKGYIARCRMFIGARTHATIAAYSTAVPTLVLGYSIKSRGIAKDLFDSEEHFVIPVQNLKDKQALAEGFLWLSEHENEIRNRLQSILPTYIAGVSNGKKAIEKLR